jgi:hypothetical protein
MEKSKDRVLEEAILKASPNVYHKPKHTHWAKKAEQVRRVESDVKIQILKEKERQSMSQPKKRKNKKQYREQTTFDPKIHWKKKGTTGYQLKKDYKVSPGELSGSQLAHILNPK